MGDKWTLLIVRDLAAGPRRFVELQRVLPGISTEQLRSRLNRMVADGLLTRKRYREVPPRVDYALTDRAQELMPVLGELARWGYDWAWSPPRASESVDISAIFRLAPGLIKPPRDVTGTVELIVTEGGTEISRCVLSAVEGRVTVSEAAAERVDARVRGEVSDWTEAFAPEPSRLTLEISGDRSLAELLLKGLGIAPRAAAGRSAAA